MRVLSGVSQDAVQLKAQHVVFVEGRDDAVFDPSVLRELLRQNEMASVSVRALGACENIHQAAKAMVGHHPSYYFLIDRDGCPDEFVEKSWANFPEPATHNLLVWRKRELENYFIDPSYFCKCPHLRLSESEVRVLILEEANRRLYFEAAMLVWLQMRWKLRQPPGVCLKLAEIHDRSSALDKLCSCDGLSRRKAEFEDLLKHDEIAKLLDLTLMRMRGGVGDLVFGTGDWLDVLSGKELLRATIGPSMRVKDRSGKFLQGERLACEVAKSLLRLPLAEQPRDFQEFVGVLRRRLQSPAS